MTDAIVCVLCLRVAVETCSPLYATLLLVRGMNPFLSILYHCFDLNILRCQSWTSESSVRRLDIFWILVATLSDLIYGQYIMGIPNSLPNDVLLLFALGTLLMPLGTHASWLLLSQLTLGMFMVRAAYVGYTTLPEPVLWCVRSVPLGIVLNVYDEYRPEGSNREYSAGLRKYLGTYDMVHVCWFLDIVFMMHLGDRPLSFVKTGEAFALQSTPMQSAMLFVSVFTGAAATCAEPRHRNQHGRQHVLCPGSVDAGPGAAQTEQLRGLASVQPLCRRHFAPRGGQHYSNDANEREARRDVCRHWWAGHAKARNEGGGGAAFDAL